MQLTITYSRNFFSQTDCGQKYGKQTPLSLYFIYFLSMLFVYTDKRHYFVTSDAALANYLTYYKCNVSFKGSKVSAPPKAVNKYGLY